MVPQVSYCYFTIDQFCSYPGMWHIKYCCHLRHAKLMLQMTFLPNQDAGWVTAQPDDELGNFQSSQHRNNVNENTGDVLLWTMNCSYCEAEQTLTPGAIEANKDTNSLNNCL